MRTARFCDSGGISGPMSLPGIHSTPPRYPRLPGISYPLDTLPLIPYPQYPTPPLIPYPPERTWDHRPEGTWHQRYPNTRENITFPGIWRVVKIMKKEIV